jgi:tetratricopeptide (TPR) repeat protein
MRTHSLTGLLVIACLALSVAPAAAGGLTESARLSAVYDDILNARFDRARERLVSACPPAPPEACLTLRVAIVWWQIALDPDSRARDAEFETVTGQAVAANEAWTRRAPDRAEAWFYLAAASAPLVQLRVLRGQRLAAAREGNRIRAALERARALDPALNDAQFGIGLYHYYADVAPAAAKVARWLLLLPGGDRRQGLREMLQARDHGELLRSEADYQLHWLYLWYEHQPARALELLSALHERHPENPLFLQRIAEVQDEYFHDHPAASATWTELLERATSGRSNAPAIAQTRARLGLAVQLDVMQETDRAVGLLRTVVDGQASAPAGAHARAHVLLGEAYDRLGDRTSAVAAYRGALATTTVSSEVDGPWRSRARTNLRRSPDPVAAEAYRLSLAGWRTLERAGIAAHQSASVASGTPASPSPPAAQSALEALEALEALTRASELAPRDPTIAYRTGRAFLVQGDVDAARRAFERALTHGAHAPAVTLAATCVAYAALLERSGERARAMALNERARSITGADPRTRVDAERARERLAR